MPAPAFDLASLFHSVDKERRAKDLSWAALSRQVGVATSTIRRFAEADDAEADGVLALVRWLGVAPEEFVSNASVPAHWLLDPRSGFVRVDMAALTEASGATAGARGRSRTTIQHVVKVAHQAGRPIASFTRISDV